MKLVKSKSLLFVCLLAIICTDKALGQSNGLEFQNDFLKKFHYPEALKNSCTATFANLLIEIADDGAIKDVIVSDSAPQLFKDEFKRMKSTLNLDLIRSLVIKKEFKGSFILIPLFYVYGSDYCVNSFDNAGYLGENYNRFDGKELQKLAYILKPIMGFMYKPMH
jgi:hypothetical protein